MTRFILMAISLICMNCAGPHNPFGSNINIGKHFEINRSQQKRNLASKQINVHSENVKLYHSPYNLKIILESPEGFSTNFRYEIIYNDRKIDRWWETENITFTPDRKKVIINFNQISLIPGIKNEIYFLFYPDKDDKPLLYTFSDPQCPIQQENTLKSLGVFDKEDMYKRLVNSTAKEHKLNPHLLASLVAQESSFNPKAISWAKAIGLTQITPLASTDILRERPKWKTYPNLRNISYPLLKYKILNGQINDKNDWRLNPQYSLEGGALFMQQLISYWSEKDNKLLLEKYLKTTPIEDIILASYNSGAYRVKKNIKKLKKEWLWSKELKEARKYVMNVKSYCHEFNTLR